MDSRSAVLKQEIEAKLSARIPAALSPQPQQSPRMLLLGIPEIDDLCGGLTLGGITEFTGMPGSGRTSLVYAALRAASREAACAYIDAEDSLDPYSAAAAGVHLANLLWVRFSTAADEKRPAASAEGTAVSGESLRRISQSGSHGGHGRHPRTETKGMDAALVTMLEKKAEARMHKAEGTPGYPNRKLSLAAASDEQIAYDHFHARRADDSDPLRQLDRMAATEARERATQARISDVKSKSKDKPWSRLDKVIRATDQVLQSGGFRVVVLDLASTPVEQALRIPCATWFRFRRATQECDAMLLLLTQQPCARSSASCVLECSTQGMRAQKTVLTSLSYSAEVARQRQGFALQKKAPGRVASWIATPEWTRSGTR